MAGVMSHRTLPVGRQSAHTREALTRGPHPGRRDRPGWRDVRVTWLQIHPRTHLLGMNGQATGRAPPSMSPTATGRSGRWTTGFRLRTTPTGLSSETLRSRAQPSSFNLGRCTSRSPSMPTGMAPTTGRTARVTSIAGCRSRSRRSARSPDRRLPRRPARMTVGSAPACRDGTRTGRPGPFLSVGQSDSPGGL